MNVGHLWHKHNRLTCIIWEKIIKKKNMTNNEAVNNAVRCTRTYSDAHCVFLVKVPVGHRITYKLCLTTWKTLNTSQPLYLSELVSHYPPSRSLQSSNTNLLTRPAGITSNFSSRTFSVSAPSTWNSLPAHIRSIDTLSIFKRHLKFHLFQSAFTV